MGQLVKVTSRKGARAFFSHQYTHPAQLGSGQAEKSGVDGLYAQAADDPEYDAQNRYVLAGKW